MKKSRCKDLVIAITYKCNSKCAMCDIWRKNSPGRLKAEDYGNLPPNLSNINITGGEPFLRDDLEQVLAVIHKASPKSAIIISTNGFASGIILEKTEKIRRIIPDIGIAVSLDGIGSKHDEIRGVPGGFEKVLETIIGLKKIGVKRIRLAFTLGDYNTSELEKVYDLSRELGIEMSLAAVHSGEKYFNAENTIKKKQEIAEALDRLIERELDSFSLKRWLRAYFAFGLKEFILTGRRILPDYSGKYNLFIDPDGDIYPNDVSSRKMGNMRNGFLNIIQASSEENPNWMICTARMAMMKNWPKFIFWIIKEMDSRIRGNDKKSVV